MRISTSMSYDRSLSYLQQTNTKIDKYSQQYNTGKKFTSAAEDPTGMGNKLRLDAEISTYKQYNVNAGLASDSLGLEETALTSIYENLQGCLTRVQSAVNGAYDEYNLDAIASALSEYQTIICDLMNTKTAEGEYIFSGNQSLSSTITKDGDKYVCNIDSGQRQVKIAPSVSVTTSDSGRTIFQQSPLARTLSSDDCTIKYTSASDIDNFINNNYVDGRKDINGNDTNSLTVEMGPDDGEYTIKSNWDNKILSKGTLGEDNTINFYGAQITLNKTNNGDTTEIKLNRPENDNVLNSLTKVINALRSDDAGDRAQILGMAQVNIQNAMEKINVTLGHVGSRLSNIDNVINSNESLNVIKQEALANISEVDAYEAVSNLVKEQNALSVAQQTFNTVHGSTLFDYI